MKFNKIKRLYEEDMVQMDMPVQPMQTMAQMQVPNMAQTQMPMDVEKALQSGEEEESLDFSTEPTVGGLDQMTVSDFLQKCKEVDPLICMGIEAFIEKHKEMLGGGMEQGGDELKDLEFGAPAEGDELKSIEFPTEENPS
jgi:hypothetical protein